MPARKLLLSNCLRFVGWHTIPRSSGKDPSYLFVFGSGIGASHPVLPGNFHLILESAILADSDRLTFDVGSAFAFVARQKRILIDSRDYDIDLLFFHRRLRCLVVIDLKIGEFEAALMRATASETFFKPSSRISKSMISLLVPMS